MQGRRNRVDGPLHILHDPILKCSFEMEIESLWCKILYLHYIFRIGNIIYEIETTYVNKKYFNGFGTYSRTSGSRSPSVPENDHNYLSSM